MSGKAIIWLRRDLRLTDHAPLQHALAHGQQPLLLYILAEAEEAPWQPGGASRWWLHRSLAALSADIAARGGELLLRRGDSLTTLQALAAEVDAAAVYWQRLYDPATIERDSRIKRALRERGLQVQSFAGYLLAEPDQLHTQAGEPYRVFTPFWRQLEQRLPTLGEAIDAPKALSRWPQPVERVALQALELLPGIDWYRGFEAHFRPGEQGAQRALERFRAEAIGDYARQRDLPAVSGTSALSPHLHFGELSIRQAAQAAAGQPGASAWLRELGWREFSHHLLRHFPHTAENNLNPRFDAFPWAEPDPDLLAAWQRGRTGIPIVDAGMRQLWQTGWMHNRVRMLVASLLTKNLRYHWSLGARWFWDTLLDANLANNTQGWQWTAGTGADAAPYFRIFNPVTQGERFDPDGDYVRRYVPELARLPGRQIHQPWSCGGVRGYPAPIVDLKQTRAEALAAFQSLRGS